MDKDFLLYRNLAMMAGWQWLWLSWYSGCFQHQRSTIRIQLLAKLLYRINYLYSVNCIENTKIKKKKAGTAF